MSEYEEILKASHMLKALFIGACGDNWSVLYEKAPEGLLAVGVQDSRGVLVIGDSENQEDFTEADAKFVAMMDPNMARFITDFLDSVRLEAVRGIGSEGTFNLALRMARYMNGKEIE
jgi:hypothetical protein